MAYRIFQEVSVVRIHLNAKNKTDTTEVVPVLLVVPNHLDAYLKLVFCEVN